MIIILLLMLAGIIFGVTLGKNEIIVKINEKLFNVAIYILLLFLGIGVGSNEKIINNLYSIGFQSLIITIGAIAGSVAICWLIYKTIFRI
jgi:uncharacterized membrane protein YbjE (DUF340 family)